MKNVALLMSLFVCAVGCGIEGGDSNGGNHGGEGLRAQVIAGGNVSSLGADVADIHAYQAAFARFEVDGNVSSRISALFAAQRTRAAGVEILRDGDAFVVGTRRLTWNAERSAAEIVGDGEVQHLTVQAVSREIDRDTQLAWLTLNALRIEPFVGQKADAEWADVGNGTLEAGESMTMDIKNEVNHILSPCNGIKITTATPEMCSMSGRRLGSKGRCRYTLKNTTNKAYDFRIAVKSASSRRGFPFGVWFCEDL